MKSNATIYLIGIILLGLLHGCKDDDATVPNTITYDGKAYAITHLRVGTYPATDQIRDDKSDITHDNYTIVFSDGDFEFKGSSWSMNGGTYLASAVIAYPASGEVPLESGTFNSILPSQYFGGNPPANEKFYTVFLIRIDLNGDGEVVANDGEFLDGSQGTLTIAVNNSKLTLDIDANKSENNEGGPTRVHYDGDFTFFDL